MNLSITDLIGFLGAFAVISFVVGFTFRWMVRK